MIYNLVYHVKEMSGIFTTLFGGGFTGLPSDPVRKKRKITISFQLPSAFNLSTYEELYKRCIGMNLNEIKKNIATTEEKLNYLEMKRKDVDIIWKICSTFLGVLLPISAYISFPLVAAITKISEEKLKLLLVGIVLILYGGYFLLFVAFLNIQSIKFYNYRLYRRVLLEVQKEKKKKIIKSTE